MSNLRANQADQGLIQYEANQALEAMHEMTTEDNQTFKADAAPWSGVAGYEPDIRPGGVITGGVVTGNGGSNEVAISALTAYTDGTLRSIGGGTEGITRATTGTLPYRINSIIVTGAGARAVVAGADGGAAYTATRGVAGGPPWIAVDAIEVAQVRTFGKVAAPITAADIHQVPGVSQERYDFPVWSEDYGLGKIQFISALPEIHSGDGGGTTSCKQVFCEVYTPLFAPLEPASDFVPPETTHSQSSTQVYGGAIGAASSALNQGSFTVFLRDGVTDPILSLKDEKLWVRFYPHRLRSAHLLAQGILGIARTFPAGDSIQASCTLTADGPAIEVAE